MNQIVSFASMRPRRVRGTHVSVGDTLYAIQDIRSRLYFIWCYTQLDQAEFIAGRVSPKDATDIAANWRRSKNELTASGRRGG